MLQVLLGISDIGQVLHTEIIATLHPLQPLQFMALAHERLMHFARVEVWEEAVCVFRYPPIPRP